MSLVMDYERTFDMAKIKEAAEAAGMKKPTAGQVEYVELGGGSKAEVYQAESDSRAEPADPQREKRCRRSGGIFPLSDAI